MAEFSESEVVARVDSLKRAQNSLENLIPEFVNEIERLSLMISNNWKTNRAMLVLSRICIAE